MGAEFLAEYADAFCDDAGYRYRGGRCDCSAGKRRTYYGDGKAQRVPSLSESHEGSGGSFGCHCAGAEYGIYAGSVLRRYCRRAVSSVRCNHRCFRGVIRFRSSDADTGLVRDFAQT